MNNIDIGPLIVSAHVVGRAVLRVPNNFLNRGAMVSNIKPIADILTVAVNRQVFSLYRVDDHHRQEFFGELKRTIIV